MDTIELIGLTAGVLTTGAFVPQAWKTWRTRRATDFALPMLVLLHVGMVLWLIYGVLIASPGLIVSNGVTLGLAGLILTVKLRHG